MILLKEKSREPVEAGTVSARYLQYTVYIPGGAGFQHPINSIQLITQFDNFNRSLLALKRKEVIEFIF